MFFKNYAFRAFYCVGAIFLTSCSPTSNLELENKPEQAGQPLNQTELAGNLAKVRLAAITGDQKAVQENMHEINENFRKSIKLADPAKSVDREQARVLAKSIEGVRSAVWLDRENLFAIVERNEQKTYDTIDRICLKLEPLGDTLGVVVNLQSGVATNGDELETLSRNCQLAPGDRAMLQKNRQIDVIPSEIREQHKANNAR